MRASHSSQRGFTLIELLVAVTVSSIIIIVLLSMTGVVADAWKNGNNKIFTNAEARAGFNKLAEDLENAVIRDNLKDAEWFVKTEASESFGGMEAPLRQPWLMFYTTPTDRNLANPGNVVTVSYKIVPQDPIKGGNSDYNLYGLYRAFPKGANPAKVTFDDALGQKDLKAFWGGHAESGDKENFYISNIFDFSFVFWVSHYGATGKDAVKTVPVEPKDELRVTADKVTIGSTVYPGAKLAAVDISMTILTQQGGQLARDGEIPKGDVQAFVANPDYARTYSHKVYFSPEAVRAFK